MKLVLFRTAALTTHCSTTLRSALLYMPRHTQETDSQTNEARRKVA